jgi:hypothetical protein
MKTQPPDTTKIELGQWAYWNAFLRVSPGFAALESRKK